MIGLCILLLTAVLKWEDIIREKGAWNMLIWFSILVTMASAINDLALQNGLALLCKGMLKGTIGF